MADNIDKQFWSPIYNITSLMGFPQSLTPDNIGISNGNRKPVAISPIFPRPVLNGFDGFCKRLRARLAGCVEVRAGSQDNWDRKMIILQRIAYERQNFAAFAVFLGDVRFQTLVKNDFVFEDLFKHKAVFEQLMQADDHTYAFAWSTMAEKMFLTECRALGQAMVSFKHVTRRDVVGAMRPDACAGLRANDPTWPSFVQRLYVDEMQDSTVLIRLWRSRANVAEYDWNVPELEKYECKNYLDIPLCDSEREQYTLVAFADQGTSGRDEAKEEDGKRDIINQLCTTHMELAGYKSMISEGKDGFAMDIIDCLLKTQGMVADKRPGATSARRKQHPLMKFKKAVVKGDAGQARVVIVLLASRVWLDEIVQEKHTPAAVLRDIVRPAPGPGVAPYVVCAPVRYDELRDEEKTEELKKKWFTEEERTRGVEHFVRYITTQSLKI